MQHEKLVQRIINIVQRIVQRIIYSTNNSKKNSTKSSTKNSTKNNKYNLTRHKKSLRYLDILNFELFYSYINNCLVDAVKYEIEIKA